MWKRPPLNQNLASCLSKAKEYELKQAKLSQIDMGLSDLSALASAYILAMVS